MGIIVHLLSRVQACQDPRKEIVLMSPLLPLMLMMISFNAVRDTAGGRISQKGPCWSIMLIWREKKYEEDVVGAWWCLSLMHPVRGKGQQMRRQFDEKGVAGRQASRQAVRGTESCFLCRNDCNLLNASGKKVGLVVYQLRTTDASVIPSNVNSNLLFVQFLVQLFR